MRLRTRWLVAISAFVSLSLSLANVARAHDGVLSDQGYERMRELAHELDGQARHASRQAEHDGVWFYRNDRTFRRSVANFARRASGFHARMDSYRTAPWQVDDELRALLRDARVVQARLQRSRYADEHTAADWSRSVDVLNEMLRIYGSEMTEPDGREGDGRRDRYEAPARRAYDSQQMGALVHELAERSARLTEVVNQLSSRYATGVRGSDSVRAIQHFADQANAFHERYEQGLRPEDVRGNVDHLWDDGRQADQRFREANVPELQREWAAMMQLLERIRGAAGF